ncbi:hypothetical protein QMO72_09965 [Staphylococcus casei]|uniref:Uncharacterized protein n=1 Tax=Staphylococcus casei TaxID=201828 RepID=A0ABZ2WD64_9STAP|nr:hypothetical protein [Staphylococcus casei]WJE85736.1 hypothetical protein QMO72_09965 [Staphylococcus casei]
MQILDYEVGIRNINYTVKTEDGIIFSHKLPKDTSSIQVRKCLKVIANKVDERNKS